MDTYDHQKILEKEFTQRLGYFNRLELPDELVSEIARFCDAHPDDTMTTYYACSLIDKFFRKRTKERWLKLFASLDSFLHRKKFLIDIFFGYRFHDETSIFVKRYSITSIWRAIDDFADDDYEKANLIQRFSYLFTEDIILLAHQRAWSMADKYRVRALAGIYPKMDAASKKEIFAYLCREFIKASSEAAYQLKLLFPFLDTKLQSELISIYLSQPDLPEHYVAYFIIRNAAFLKEENAQKCINKAREFRSEYFRNRCLLKLSNYLPAGEIEVLHQHFIESFAVRKPSTALIHNLYHFSAALKNLDKDSVIDMALDKIAQFDDSQNECYEQNKYKELSFITPLLNEKHLHKAFAIAESVRGGYKKNITSRLRRHFSNSANYCSFRYSAICY